MAGHGRILAAKRARVKRVPVLRVEHLSPTQVKAFRIQDNRLAELGTWDVGILLEEFAELQLEGVNPDDMGFDKAAMEALDASLGSLGDDEGAPDDEPTGKGQKGLTKPKISYEIVFDTSAQQETWYELLRHLKTTQGGDTIGARLSEFASGFLAGVKEKA